MDFDSTNRSVKELLSDKIFKIPINQRKYVWSERNWKDLLTDVFLVCDENTKGHFIGSIVLEDNGKNDAIKFYKIIDGQQRIISIVILLSSLYQIYLEKGLLKESEAIKRYCFAFNSNNDMFFVLENAEPGLKEMVIDVFSKTEAFDFIWIEKPLKNKNNENIFNAYNYFYEQLKNKISLQTDKRKYLLKIFQTIIGIDYIDVVTSASEDSFTIFEILNARGQKLEDHELLKNLVLKYSKNKEDTKNKWQIILQNVTTKGKCYIKNFIKHYSMHKYLSKSYSSPYLVIRENVDKANIEDLINDLFVKSNIYREFLAPDEINESEIRRNIYVFFNANKQTQYRPLIMSLTNQFNKGQMTKEQFDNALIFLKKYFICFTLISMEKSNKIENVIYKYSSLLENNYTDENLRDLIDSLKNKFPSKILFSKRLETVAWSHKPDSPYNEEKMKERIKIIFNLIEEFNTGRSCIVDFTIEHILPDDGGDTNSKIGNLLPLERHLNERCKNKTFLEKLKIYNESQIQSVRKFCTIYKNQQFRIESRHNYVVDLLYEKILTY